MAIFLRTDRGTKTASTVDRYSASNRAGLHVGRLPNGRRRSATGPRGLPYENRGFHALPSRSLPSVRHACRINDDKSSPARSAGSSAPRGISWTPMSTCGQIREKAISSSASRSRQIDAKQPSERSCRSGCCSAGADVPGATGTLFIGHSWAIRGACGGGLRRMRRSCDEHGARVDRAAPGLSATT